jgi:uncharacterized protein (TIGR00369 family)
MKPPRSAAEQRKLESAMRELFEQRITFNQVLGLKVRTVFPEPVIVFAMRPELVGHYAYGRLHGGVISAVLDATSGLAIMAKMALKHQDESADQVMQRFSRMGTIDLRTDFLEQGLGNEFSATARVNRLGGRLASAQMVLHNELGHLLATGTASYVIS